jgi:hypothetical protein
MATMLMTGPIMTVRDDCETINQHITRHEQAVKSAGLTVEN